MRMVLVGGGTGGHFYPLIAIAEAVRQKDATAGQNTELFYIGPEPYNQQSLDANNIKFVYCPAGKQRLYNSVLNFLDKFKVVLGIFVAFFQLLRLYPDVVMSKGGYTSVPVVLAAWLLRIPIVVHESDAMPGRANLLGSRLASYIAVAFDEVAEYFPAGKVALVGMPIRQAFFKDATDPYAALGIPKDRPVLMITGGSSGAQRLNDFVLRSLNRLLENYTVLHQTGDMHEQKVTSDAAALFSDKSQLDHYFVFGHLDQEQFVSALQAASLVLSRGGSTTLFELSLKGKPAIIIPIPEDISRDQRSNAYAYARKTGAVVLEEHNLSDDLLMSEIDRVLGDPEIAKQMSVAALSFTTPDAAYKLADILIAIGKQHENPI